MVTIVVNTGQCWALLGNTLDNTLGNTLGNIGQYTGQYWIVLGNTLDNTGQNTGQCWAILVRKDSGGRTLNTQPFASIHDGDEEEEEFVIVMSAQVE